MAGPHGGVATGGCDKLHKTKWTTLEGTDGRSKIRIPAGWKPTKGLNALASVQAQHDRTASFLLVLTEDKDDFAPYSLERYSKLVRGMMKGRAQEYAEAGPRRLAVGPYKAIQYELRATVLGFQQRMLHTCVEGPRYTHQVLLWTNAHLWSKQKPLFQKILQSFRELQGPKPKPGGNAAAVALTEVQALNRTSALQVPSTWKDLPQLNPAATVRRGDQRRNRYAVVLSDAKILVPQFTTLAAFGKRVEDLMRKGLPDYQASLPQSLTIAGRPALQRVVRGNVNGVRLVYLMTLVDGPTHYHRILLWSLATDWERARPLFERVARTFRPAGR